MLALSQTTGYAILALSYLERCSGRWVLAKEIADCMNIPLPYLSKLLNSLARTGVIEAKRGYRGGFVLAQPADCLTLLQIIQAVEGEVAKPRCLLGLAECSDERGCPTHRFWKVERDKIQQELQRITLAEASKFEQMYSRQTESNQSTQSESAA